MVKRMDLTGQRFGKLVAVSEAGKDKGRQNTWLCKCDCGKSKVVRTGNLKHHMVRSCGCIIGLHGGRRKGIDLINWRNENDLVEGTKLTSINREVFSNNKSGVTGVFYSNRENRWRAQLNIKGKKVLNRSFHNKKDAVNARKEAEQEYFKPILEKYRKE